MLTNLKSIVVGCLTLLMKCTPGPLSSASPAQGTADSCDTITITPHSKWFDGFEVKDLSKISFIPHSKFYKFHKIYSILTVNAQGHAIHHFCDWPTEPATHAGL